MSSVAELSVAELIVLECSAIRNLLLKKNAMYGNTAFEPRRIFSKASPVEQLCIRIDDKLGRIETMGRVGTPDEDTVLDLIGYLILLRVSARLREQTPAKEKS
jgi:hypothetical protein